MKLILAIFLAIWSLATCEYFPIKYEKSFKWCSEKYQNFHVGDFDGDGKDDFLCHRGYNLLGSEDEGGEVWIAYSQVPHGVNGGDDWKNLDLGLCKGESRWKLIIGDFNGDTRDDLLCYTTSGYAELTLASVTGQFLGDLWKGSINECLYSTLDSLLVGDFNGDGRDDLLCDQNSAFTIVYANAGGTLGGHAWRSTFPWCEWQLERWTGDFNGDGRHDLLCHNYQNGFELIAFAEADGTFKGVSWSEQMGWCYRPAERLFIGDFNGDGRDDTLCHNTVNGDKYVSLATSNGTFDGFDWGMDADLCSQAPIDPQFFVGRFNAGDSDDMMCKSVDTIWIQMRN